MIDFYTGDTDPGTQRPATPHRARVACDRHTAQHRRNATRTEPTRLRARRTAEDKDPVSLAEASVLVPKPPTTSAHVPAHNNPQIHRRSQSTTNRRTVATPKGWPAHQSPATTNTDGMRIRIRQLYPFPPCRLHELFNSLFKVLFNFPSRYLFAIGFVAIFSLR